MQAVEFFIDRRVILTGDGEVEVKHYITIGGRRTRVYDNDGYMYTSRPHGQGSIGVHRIVMELALGRRLERGEHVHHRDGNRANNILENLEVIPVHTHNSLHTRERNLRHNPDDFTCGDCGGSEVPHKALGVCDNCYARRKRRGSTKRPCLTCGRETINRGVYLDGLCAGCARDTWDACRECGRTRQELPKTTPVIDPNGLCRACFTRLERQLAK